MIWKFHLTQFDEDALVHHSFSLTCLCSTDWNNIHIPFQVLF